MKKVEFSDSSKEDLDEIWLYIARDNPEIATRFIKSFDTLFKLLGNNPFVGRSCDDFFGGLRYFPHGRYLIFYFPTSYGVRIHRVLHSARNIPKIFSEESE